MSAKYFTLEEANRTLPFVRRVVDDIVREYAEWKRAVRRFELLAGTTAQGETDEQRAARQRVEELAERIEGYTDELTRVGCVFKGFDEGLVDFYAQRDGRDVFLCWKLGEPSVQHWHELDAGFAGRQPLVEKRVSGKAE